jgi:hypothetical protein
MVTIAKKYFLIVYTYSSFTISYHELFHRSVYLHLELDKIIILSMNFKINGRFRGNLKYKIFF